MVPNESASCGANAAAKTTAIRPMRFKPTLPRGDPGQPSTASGRTRDHPADLAVMESVGVDVEHDVAGVH